jgi:hypothetical protein
MFSLTIHDDTGTMTVILFGDDASKFLSDVPATNFNECNFSLSRVQHKIYSLINNDTPVDDPNNNTPKNTYLLDCCIKSYFSPSRQKCFRMFDTILKT